MKCSLRHERELRTRGFARIAGIDEAGRGPLAGPVVAAAVILPEKFRHKVLTDSKQLSAARRPLTAIERIDPAAARMQELFDAGFYALQELSRSVDDYAGAVDDLRPEPLTACVQVPGRVRDSRRP